MGEFAWVVAVSGREEVGQALVSGESLRRVRSSAHVVALASDTLPPEDLRQLGSVFEMLIVRPERGTLMSLSCFSKVLVVAPGLVLGEQSDHLFEAGNLQDHVLVVTDEDKRRRMVVRLTPQSGRTLENLLSSVEDVDAAREMAVSLGSPPQEQHHRYFYVGRGDPRGEWEAWRRTQHSPEMGVPPEPCTKNWIAVVGMACQFPGADNLEEYWELLEQGRNTCQVNPRPGTAVRGNWLKGPLDQFDAHFFGLAPSEMGYTDPQARLLLETSWRALEHAHLNPDLLCNSKAGVFSGIWLQDYKELMIAEGGGDMLRQYLGNAFGSTAAKLSFFYGLTGPNVSTESGCSSSLVALHLAGHSLLRRECPLALVCGANVILQSGAHSRIWAEDGLCKTWDAGADGYARAEGVAVLVLKRYADALQDGDEIQGVIRGTATAQEGLSKSFGAPTVESESRCMREALEKAGVGPEQVDLLEAHATGTAVGDPIEAAAILQAYRPEKGRTTPLWISSGKTNIGHTESVSGLAGVVKVLLALQHEKIPAHLNFTTMNPKVNFESINGVIPLESQPWPRDPARVRLAGVSSFGITGTDVHVILQEPPPASLPQKRAEEGNAHSPQVLLLSAKSPAALDQLVERFSTHLDTNGDVVDLPDVCFTAATCRPHHAHRTAYLARSLDELRHKLKAPPESSECCPQNPPRVCFTFPGRIGKMDLSPIRHLYQDNAYFRRCLRECDAVFQEVNASDQPFQGLVSTLLADQTAEPRKSWEWYNLVPTYQYCLALLWRHWGVEPTLVVGHCLGEIPAALTSGCLSLPDAYRLLRVIPKLIAAQEKCPAGMVALERDAEESQALIHTFLQNQPPIPAKFWLDVACCNGRRQTVIAGPAQLVPEFARFCRQQSNKARAMEFSMDFCAHSRAVEGVMEESQPLFQQLVFSPPKLPYLSSYTGALIDSQSEALLTGAQFVRGVLRHSVRFTEACQTLSTLDLASVYLEMGVDGSLSKLLRGNLGAGSGGECVPSFLGESASFSAELRVEASLGAVYTLGANINWGRVYESESRRKRVTLPGYPFQRKSFWFESKKPESEGKSVMSASLEHPLLGNRVQGPLLQEQGVAVVGWQNNYFLTLPQTSTFVGDHVIGGQLIFPGAGFLEMMLSCCNAVQISSFKIHAPLHLSQEKGEGELTVQTVWNPEKGQVSIYSSGASSSWRLHASAATTPHTTSQDVKIDTEMSFTAEERARCTRFYEAAAQVELQFGATFQSLAALRDTPSGDLIAQVKQPPEEEIPFALHPVLLDAMIQTAMIHQHQNPSQLYVPVRLGSFTHFPVAPSSSPPPRDSHWLVYSTDKGATLHLVDPSGNLRGRMSEPELVSTSVKSLFTAAGFTPTAASDADAVNKYLETWEPAPFYQPSSSSHNPPGEEGLTEEEPHAVSELSPEETSLDHKINRLCELYVAQALESLEEGDVVPALQPAFRHFRTYRPPPVPEVEKEVASILEDPVVSAYPALSTLTTCGARLGNLLRGRVSAQELLFDPGTRLAEKYYQHTRFRGAIDAVGMPVVWQQLRRLRGVTSPVRILEVGAGTGALARVVVPELEGDTPFEYHFTDVSANLVAQARQQFKDFKSVVFQVLDVEGEPLAQGFPPHYFDLVVCVNVLHATRLVSRALSNLSRLCKPGGVLLLGETVMPVREVDICFGGMHDYWNFADPVRLRQGHCTLSADTWLDMLRDHGFTRHLRSYPTHNHQMAVISATKEDVENDAPSQTNLGTWQIFHPEEEEPNKQMLEFGNLVKGRAGRQVKFVARDAPTQTTLMMGDVEGIQVWMGMEGESRRVVEPLLQIAQGLLAAKPTRLPRLQLIIRGGEDNPLVALAVGLMRNIRIELPGLKTKVVRLPPPPSSSPGEGEWLLTEMWLEDRETEVVYNKEQQRRLVRRLQEDKTAPLAIDIPAQGEFRVRLPPSRVISEVSFTATPPTKDSPLGEEEVRVEVRCVSLNFRDVMAVLKPSPAFDKITGIGLDYSGEVVHVGREVTRWKPGDLIFGCSWNSKATRSHLNAHQHDVEGVPDHLTLAEAATLPAVFVTAWHCLVNLARVRKGDTVLVHAASGGVGLAVIQLAKLLDFQVIGTAGSARKREYLRRECGLAHVFNSRTLAFEEEVRQATQGKGVDIILNCLTGPGFKEASLAVCKEGGHFVEISMLNIWSAAQVQELRPRVKYWAVDASTLEPALAREIMGRIREMVNSRQLQPLPHVQFPATQLPEALTYLQKARQIGKVIVRVGGALFNERSTYMITGGKGAIGWAIAKWMVSRGARYLVLVGRSPPSAALLQEISALEQEYQDCHIVCKELDIADYPQLENLICQEIPEKLQFPPLRGVHHAAGILSDKAIAHQDWPNFERVLHPKMNGSWNLHLLTKSLLLEHFVLHSSAAATFGNAGQSNYVSANCFLDALAAHRRALHLPALSINWGQWKTGLAESVHLDWLQPFTVSQGIDALETLMLRWSAALLPENVVVGQFHFTEVMGTMPFYKTTFLHDLLASNSKQTAAAVGDTLFAGKYKAGKTPAERKLLLRDFILRTLSQTLGLSHGEIGASATLSDMGMDSLMSIEFSNRIIAGLETLVGGGAGTLAAIDLETHGTLEKLTSHIFTHVLNEKD